MIAKLVRSLGIDPAPNWFVRCPDCGREATAESVGLVRLGARSVGKRILGRCSQCGGRKSLEIYRKPPAR